MECSDLGVSTPLTNTESSDWLTWIFTGYHFTLDYVHQGHATGYRMNAAAPQPSLVLRASEVCVIANTQVSHVLPRLNSPVAVMCACRIWLLRRWSRVWTMSTELSTKRRRRGCYNNCLIVRENYNNNIIYITLLHCCIELEHIRGKIRHIRAKIEHTRYNRTYTRWNPTYIWNVPHICYFWGRIRPEIERIRFKILGTPTYMSNFITYMLFLRTYTRWNRTYTLFNITYMSNFITYMLFLRTYMLFFTHIRARFYVRIRSFLHVYGNFTYHVYVIFPAYTPNTC